MKLGMIMNSGYNLVVGLVLTSVALTSICCVVVGAGSGANCSGVMADLSFMVDVLLM